MYAPALHDESTSLRHQLDAQLSALHACVLGLTEEQVRATPCRSVLSVGGLLKHVTHGMRGAITRLTGGTVPAYDEAVYAAYQRSFTLTGDESGHSVLADFEQVRQEFLAVVAEADPDTELLEPPSPWYGIPDARPVRTRYLLLHLVEEFARHAGHADIVREQLDGLSVPALQMTEEGVRPNEFFTPYVPAPGTVGAPVSRP
ncbi:DinB family protein [Kineococcus sp. SYSU DK003]|uniref:DinB family protein n=1 Tax=Kineococcus sp. SYSU DK003 TaxID=3383124 RepID=UPI003D7DAE14